MKRYRLAIVQNHETQFDAPLYCWISRRAKMDIAIYYTNIRLNQSIDQNKFMIKISDRAEQIDGTLYSEQ